MISIFTAEEQGDTTCYLYAIQNAVPAKKAQKWLDESGAEYTLRDIKTDNPTAEELKTWWEKRRSSAEAFF